MEEEEKTTESTLERTDLVTSTDMAMTLVVVMFPALKL